MNEQIKIRALVAIYTSGGYVDAGTEGVLIAPKAFPAELGGLAKGHPKRMISVNFEPGWAAVDVGDVALVAPEAESIAAPSDDADTNANLSNA